MTVVCLVCIVASSSAQFGVSAAYEFGIPLGLARAENSYNWCTQCDGSGYSWNHTVRIGSNLLARDLFSEQHGLDARFSIGWSTGRFVSDSYKGDPFLDPVTQIFITPLSEFTAEADFLLARMVFQYSYAATASIRLGLGPWIEYRLVSDVVHKERILAPEGMVYPGSAASGRVVSSGEELTSAPVSGGIMFSADLALTPSTSVPVLVRLFSNIDLRAVSGDQGWKSFNIGAGISLPLAGHDAVLPITGDSRPAPQIDRGSQLGVNVRIEPLNASIDLFSTDESGAALEYVLIETVRKLHTSAVSMHPLVYFPKNSSKIPKDYLLLRSQETDRFSSRNLLRLDPLQLYYHTLNVVGFRMRRNPGAGLIITASNAEAERSSVAGERAETIKTYLRDVWGIVEARMTLRVRRSSARTAAEEGSARHVAISSADPAILRPVRTEWIFENLRTTPVNLVPDVNTGHGVRNWSIRITHGSETVAAFGRGSKESPGTIDVGLLLAKSKDIIPVPPLVAQLFVEDSAGFMRTATDELPFYFVYPSMDEEDPSSVSNLDAMYVLHGSELTGSEAALRNRTLLDEISSIVRAGDRITIAPVLLPVHVSDLVRRQLRSEVEHIAGSLHIRLGTDRGDISIKDGFIQPSKEPRAELLELPANIGIRIVRTDGR